MTDDDRDPFEALAAELAEAAASETGFDLPPDIDTGPTGELTGDSGTDEDAEPAVPIDELDPSEVPAEVRGALEAILMVAEEPVAPSLLAQLLEIPTAVVVALCEHLAVRCEEEERGFTVARVAGGFRFQSAAAQAPYVERFLLEGQSARLSAAALETLAIVAYKQPISRAQIASIRGVNVDGVVRTLQQRGYIAEIGRDPGPGNAVLYGSTRLFLERLGLDHLGQLPSLGDFVPDADVVETLELALRGGDDDAPTDTTDTTEAGADTTGSATGA